MLRGLRSILRDEGIRGFYKGLPASLMRESSYSTIRLGAYEPIKRLLGATDPAHTPLWKKICAGATSGAIGSSIATPTDLVKVRMQACTSSSKGGTTSSSSTALHQKPVYESTLGAFTSIYREAGLKGLYRGVGPTVMRATILTATQIPTYDHVKHTLLNWGWFRGEGLDLHITASMMAGLASAATTSPVDVVKTRYMRQIQHSGVYTSSLDCVMKSFSAEGVLGLYKGFIPNWMRIGPHTIVTFLIFEQLRSIVGMRPV
ncbi:mitochondrial substrate carrier family protein ucpB-like isoform X2 [Symsagittifera roscoffensis]